ncbi:MAG TPA: rhomboid family intramembrane serine protease, partial [Trebonia sp.]|nr:rhomboid family intramembrane serine protease [Trebonia sp.]
MSLRKFRDALIVMGVFLAVIWILQVFNWADGYRLDGEFGILPEHASRLPEIFTAPFLHFSWQHIEGNSIPLFVLGVLAAYRSVARFLFVSFIIAVVSGLAVWLFQSSNELTVGASGLIFGYFGYVLVRGFVDRNLVDIGVGLVAGVLYWTILQVAIPGTPGVSWIGHIGGLAGGVLAAWLVRSPQPVQRPPRRPAVGGGPSGPSGPARFRGPSRPGGSSGPGRPPAPRG